MVEVHQAPALETTRSTVGNFWEWVSGAWPYFLLMLIIIILVIVAYYLLKKIEDERKERDEVNYALYKQIIATCRIRADKKKINRKWNWKSLFMIFIPFPPVWFLIPFIKTEHSVKYVDMSGNLIGYYRGEYKSMDGTVYALVYKKKNFIIFEDVFLLKIPISVPYILEEKKKMPGGDIKLIKHNRVMDLSDRYVPLGNGDIMIKCIDIERLGQYYYCPVYYYEYDGSINVVDYRKIMETAIHDNTNQLLLQRVTGQMKKQMEAMPSFNPFIVSSQKMPEKTKEEQNIEG